MHRAFTLIELITVIVVLAVLSALAVPRYFDFSRDAQVSAIATSLKTIRRGIVQYRLDYGSFPPDQLGATMPPELAPYFQNDAWSAAITGVGVYNWDGPPGWDGSEAIGISALTSMPSSPSTDPFWRRIDAAIDDGNLTTGLFQWESGSQRYRMYVDPH